MKMPQINLKALPSPDGRKEQIMKVGKWRFALAAIGLGGMCTAITAVTPALGVTGTAASGTAVRIVSAHQTAPVVISDSVQTVVRLKVPAGHWLVTGKLYADSVPSTTTPTATLGCTLHKGSTAPVLDSSFFNVPKAPGNTAAGVIYLNTVIRPTTTITIILQCADFNSQVETHWAALTAIAG
jgi:hypothetical protein